MPATWSSDPREDLRKRTSRDLLRMYGMTLTILIERGVIRTRSAPAGDLAERLVADAYGGTLERNSNKSHDVMTPDRKRIQVKCRVSSTAKGSRVYGAFRSWDFDTCVFVRLDPVSYDVLQAYEVPVAGVRKTAAKVARVGASRIRVSTPFQAIEGAVDIRGTLQEALNRLLDADVEAAP